VTRTLPGHGSCRHRFYGLNCRDYEQILTDTQQRCELCGVGPRGNTYGKLFIDHDPSVGQWAVRGLLCHRCNSLIADKPGWGVVLPAGTEGYLANPWFKRKLAEAGATLEGPLEPLEGGKFTDTWGYRWEKYSGEWRCSCSRIKWSTWKQIMHRLGPYAITITDPGQLSAHLDDLPALVQIIRSHMNPQQLQALVRLLSQEESPS
jgi:hypothetical protein